MKWKEAHVMSFENKYRMNEEQNVFLAKRNIVDYIWKSARLEGETGFQ